MAGSNRRLKTTPSRVVPFMLDTGGRLAEVAGLTLADLNLKSGTAKVNGKGSKERLVYFSEGVTDALIRWLTVRGGGPGSLF